jgi:hypothetical protein
MFDVETIVILIPHGDKASPELDLDNRANEPVLMDVIANWTVYQHEITHQYRNPIFVF